MSDRERMENIEARIHQAQDELRIDLEALGEKLSLENLKADAWGRLETAKELARDMALNGTREAGEAVRKRVDVVADRILDSDLHQPALSLLGLALVVGVGLLLVWDRRHGTWAERGYDRPRLPEHASEDLPPPMVASRPYVR